MGDLIHFALSNARRFYSSRGENWAAIGLNKGMIMMMFNFRKFVEKNELKKTLFGINWLFQTGITYSKEVKIN